METLEIREAIEDACGGSPEARAALECSVTELRRAEIGVLGSAFARVLGDDEQGDPALRVDLEAAADSLVRLRYLDRMVARLAGDP
jgi:hypothetical protein